MYCGMFQIIKQDRRSLLNDNTSTIHYHHHLNIILLTVLLPSPTSPCKMDCKINSITSVVLCH